jgi:hypothetical protein
MTFSCIRQVQNGKEPRSPVNNDRPNDDNGKASFPTHRFLQAVLDFELDLLGGWFPLRRVLSAALEKSQMRGLQRAATSHARHISGIHFPLLASKSDTGDHQLFLAADPASAKKSVFERDPSEGSRLIPRSANPTGKSLVDDSNSGVCSIEHFGIPEGLSPRKMKLDESISTAI